MSHIKGGGGGRRSVTLCDKGGIQNFVTSHFKNSTKAILHILTIFLSRFDLMLILFKNNLLGNKNNFGTAVLI